MWIIMISMDRVLHSLVCVSFFVGWYLIQYALLAFPGITTYNDALAAWPLFTILFILPYSLFSRAYYQKRTGLMPFGTVRFSDLRLPIIAMVILSVATMFYGEDETSILEMLTLSPLHQFILVVSVVFAAPIIEEIIFRGFLLNAGMGYGPNGKHVMIIITSVLFAMIHHQYNSPATFIMIFVMSVIFCHVRIQTNSLMAPIILHMINNAVAMLLLFLLNDTP
ncbi:CPBP family intramembrane metalloprotease [Providencia stuartii]|nr:CPBP family intramembrane metalloprotease [Providencia stuartii]